MNIQDLSHQQMVDRLNKPGQAIIDDLTPAKAHLLHMAVGIAGEAGELLDAVKKNAIYKKELDIDNVIEELGDLEYFMQGLRAALHLTRGETLANNIAKLEKRYPSGYSNAAAQARADKA